jgi:molybdopterin synthase catalytic subunit
MKNNMVDLKITSEPLNITSAIDYVTSEECGGIDVFIGTVRNETKGKKVVRLEFECYESMAMKEMEKIALQIRERWPVHRILMHHRTGVLQIKDIPVIIAVSAAHRDAAFDACRYAIDTLKQTVPVWKKEIFADGEEWVSANP